MTSASIILVVVKISLAFAVLAIGLRSSEGDATWLIRRPRLLARSLLSMNVIVPLVALAVTQALDLTPPVRVALVALSISPAPPILPNQTGKAGGEAAYAIGLLTIISLIAIVLVPASLAVLAALFGRTTHLDPKAVAVLMAQTVLSPLAVGILVRHFAPAWAARAARPVNVVAMLLLAAGFGMILVGAWPAMRRLLGNGTVVAAVVVTAAALFVGHELGGPDDMDRPVLALASALRHPAVGIAVANAAFPDSKLVAPAVLLQFVVAAIAALPYVKLRGQASARRTRPDVAVQYRR